MSLWKGVCTSVRDSRDKVGSYNLEEWGNETTLAPTSSSSLTRRALTYAHTLRYLKLSQIVARLARMVVPQPHVKPPFEVGSLRGLWPLEPFICPVPPRVSPGEIAFLNHTRAFNPSAACWAMPDMPKLWRYNLHYFDFLHWHTYSVNDKTSMIESWISEVLPGAEDGWDPYPLSLRVVNWLKFFVNHPADVLSPDWLSSLTAQLHWLERDLEYHLLGNHLLKNAKALIFGGIAFEGAAATRWFERGWSILRAQTREQTLQDGGHFERSPMYHCVVLEDYLDIVNVMAKCSGLVARSEMNELLAVARRATEFLGAIRGGDGDIGLFNDSAHEVAPSAARLLMYAESVLTAAGARAGRSEERVSGEPTRICLSQSGYFGYRCGGDSLIVDCGEIGPDYQPGHAHCDTLSYELCVDGRRIVVDSGVHDYEMGLQREYDRSTRAHNTVMVDCAEQSEVWGAFRVARRARPLFAELSEWSDGELTFRGAHDGYHRIQGRVSHERVFFIRKSGRWEIRDRLTGRGWHRVHSFVHLHPDCAVDHLSDSQWRISLLDGVALRLLVNGGTVRLVEGWYSPEFGKRIRNQVLVIEKRGSLPIEFGYVLERMVKEGA